MSGPQRDVPVIPVRVRRDGGAADLPLPAYATEKAAGMDLRAAIDAALTLQPGERARVSTGIRLALPDGYEGQVRPRSGLAWREGLTLLNAPGTVDADYTGIVFVVLINLGQQPVVVERGDRIAQLVVAPVVRVHWAEDEGESAEAAAAGKAGRGKAGRGEAGRGKAGRGKAGRGKAGRGKAGRGKAGRGKAGRGKAGRGEDGFGSTGRR